MNKSDSLLFLGDVIPFKPFIFRNSYKTVINLETPIIHEGVPVRGKINLKVKNNYLNKIFKSNLLCVSIANNHILDFGKEGLFSTLKELQKSGIKYVGLHESNDKKKITPVIIDFNGCKIAFLSVVCMTTSPLIETDNSIHLNLLDVEEIENTVCRIRNSVKRIVLFIHWGIEESSYPASGDILIARRLIESGIDVIIGSHAHAPQPVEKYKNGIIAYNLGNFIMPELKNIPSYFTEKGSPSSYYSKKLMLWNRISWGLVIDMKTLDFKILKYSFFFNRILRLAYSPLDKYINMNHINIDESYETAFKKHLKKRKFTRKVLNFLYRPYIPEKFLNHENRSSSKFK